MAFWLGARLTRAPAAATRAGALILGASAFQGFIGYLQYFTGVPVALVSLHMLGACLVWLAALGVLMSTRRRGGSVVGVDARDGNA